MPTEYFIEWFRSLPISHRVDIAASIGTFCPGYDCFEISDDLDLVPERFIAEVEKKTTSPFHTVAALVGIREWIQIFFIDERSDKAGWKDAEYELKAMAEVSGSKIFNESAQQAELRGRQWLVTCEKWNELLRNHLSNEKLKIVLKKPY